MKFANLIGYSDIVPFEVVRVISEKTVEIREMNATIVDGWKPEIMVGGFLGHCTNNNTQEYTYSTREDSPVIRARLQKNGKWKSIHGEHRMSDKPKRFYDYNF
jgi:hypothetical protein